MLEWFQIQICKKKQNSLCITNKYFEIKYLNLAFFCVKFTEQQLKNLILIEKFKNTLDVLCQLLLSY